MRAFKFGGGGGAGTPGADGAAGRSPFRGDWTNGTSYLVGDIVRDTENGQFYVAKYNDPNSSGVPHVYGGTWLASNDAMQLFDLNGQSSPYTLQFGFVSLYNSNANSVLLALPAPSVENKGWRIEVDLQSVQVNCGDGNNYLAFQGLAFNQIAGLSYPRVELVCDGTYWQVADFTGRFQFWDGNSGYAFAGYIPDGVTNFSNSGLISVYNGNPSPLYAGPGAGYGIAQQFASQGSCGALVLQGHDSGDLTLQLANSSGGIGAFFWADGTAQFNAGVTLVGLTNNGTFNFNGSGGFNAAVDVYGAQRNFGTFDLYVGMTIHSGGLSCQDGAVNFQIGNAYWNFDNNGLYFTNFSDLSGYIMDSGANLHVLAGRDFYSSNGNSGVNWSGAGSTFALLTNVVFENGILVTAN